MPLLSNTWEIMQRSDIAKIYSKQSNITQTEADRHLSNMLNIIAEKLYEGYDVNLQGLVKFTNEERKARTYTTPQGIEINSPKKYYVKAKVSHSLQKKVKSKKVYGG